MKITIKCFATLYAFSPKSADEYIIQPGLTIAQLISELGIPMKEIKLVFVNGAQVPIDTILKDGDRVGLFPAVGGG